MRERILLMVLLVATPAIADEVLTVSTPPPVVQDVPVRYELTDLRLRTWPEARIDVRLTAFTAGRDCAKDVRGECQTIAVAYTGEAAVTLINMLNSANLSANSLRKRVLTKLQADGVLPPGTISGAAGLPTLTPTPLIPTATPTSP